jgi:hypothetical protein
MLTCGIVVLLLQGREANEKCPVEIADFVLLYNAEQEGLYGASDRSAFDLFELCPGIKSGLSNFVKLTSNAFALSCLTFE